MQCITALTLNILIITKMRLAQTWNVQLYMYTMIFHCQSSIKLSIFYVYMLQNKVLLKQMPGFRTSRGEQLSCLDTHTMLQRRLPSFRSIRIGYGQRLTRIPLWASEYFVKYNLQLYNNVKHFNFFIRLSFGYQKSSLT